MFFILNIVLSGLHWFTSVSVFLVFCVVFGKSLFVFVLVWFMAFDVTFLLTIALSVLWSTTSVYLFAISWSLYFLSSDLRLLFTSLVSLGDCIVYPLIYDFCLPLWYLLARDTKEVNRSRISEDRKYNDQQIPKR
jgi:hypothetical protein